MWRRASRPLNAAAALLGAPLGHDFAAISLSDLLTPWPVIEKRLMAAASADFVVALFNPKSARRDWQLSRAREILLRERAGATPVGIVHNAYRPGQSVCLTTLEEMDIAAVDMFAIVIVGNSTSRSKRAGLLLTPKVRVRYSTRGRNVMSARQPDEIIAESFRIIDAEVGPHAFNAREWPIVRRMIHAAGDLELVRSVRFHNDPVAAAADACSPMGRRSSPT